MDPVSHVVAAWCINSLGTREARLTAAAPVRGRGLAITLGALAPDIDALMMPAGWDRYLAVHELGTHSLPGAVACGAAAAGVAMLVRRRTAYGPLILPAVIGAVSHVAADLLSGASIRIGWPFLDAQVANLGVVAMADPWLLAASLLTGLALTRTRRRHVVAMSAVSMFVMLTIGVSLVRERAELVYRQHQGRGTVVGSYLIEPVSGSVRTWRFTTEPIARPGHGRCTPAATSGSIWKCLWRLVTVRWSTPHSRGRRCGTFAARMRSRLPWRPRQGSSGPTCAIARPSRARSCRGVACGRAGSLRRRPACTS